MFAVGLEGIQRKQLLVTRDLRAFMTQSTDSSGVAQRLVHVQMVSTRLA